MEYEKLHGGRQVMCRAVEEDWEIDDIFSKIWKIIMSIIK